MDQKKLNEPLPVVELLGHRFLFYDGKLTGDQIPEGFYAYDLRGSDDDPGYPATIEPFVVVNFCGTVLTDRDIFQNTPGDARVFFLRPMDDNNGFTGEVMTPDEFIGRYARRTIRVRLTATIELDRQGLQDLKRCTHHADWLFDLESWHDIQSVEDVRIEEIE